MKEQLEKIKEEALQQISSAESLDTLNDIRVAYLGKKGEHEGCGSGRPSKGGTAGK